MYSAYTNRDQLPKDIVAIPHNTMKMLMSERNSGVNLKTVMQIIRGLDMTTAQFFDNPLFESPDLEID